MTTPVEGSSVNAQSGSSAAADFLDAAGQQAALQHAQSSNQGTSEPQAVHRSPEEPVPGAAVQQAAKVEGSSCQDAKIAAESTGSPGAPAGSGDKPVLDPAAQEAELMRQLHKLNTAQLLTKAQELGGTELAKHTKGQRIQTIVSLTSTSAQSAAAVSPGFMAVATSSPEAHASEAAAPPEAMAPQPQSCIIQDAKNGDATPVAAKCNEATPVPSHVIPDGSNSHTIVSPTSTLAKSAAALPLVQWLFPQATLKHKPLKHQRRQK